MGERFPAVTDRPIIQVLRKLGVSVQGVFHHRAHGGHGEETGDSPDSPAREGIPPCALRFLRIRRIPQDLLRGLRVLRGERLQLAFAFFRSGKGSHEVWRRESDERHTIVPRHAGKTIKRRTLKAILEDAGITIEELRQLLR